MNITKDDYEVWKDNHVTKQFMLEILEDLEILRNMRIVGDHEQMIRLAHERNANMLTLGSIISWKPAELNEETND